MSFVSMFLIQVLELTKKNSKQFLNFSLKKTTPLHVDSVALVLDLPFQNQ